MNDDHYDEDHDHDDHDDVYLCNLLAKSGGVVARSGRGWQCLLKVLRGDTIAMMMMMVLPLRPQQAAAA